MPRRRPGPGSRWCRPRHRVERVREDRRAGVERRPAAASKSGAGVPDRGGGARGDDERGSRRVRPASSGARVTWRTVPRPASSSRSTARGRPASRSSDSSCAPLWPGSRNGPSRCEPRMSASVATRSATIAARRSSVSSGAVTSETTARVVPCARCSARAARIASGPSSYDAPPPPCPWMSMKPGVSRAPAPATRCASTTVVGRRASRQPSPVPVAATRSPSKRTHASSTIVAAVRSDEPDGVDDRAHSVAQGISSEAWNPMPRLVHSGPSAPTRSRNDSQVRRSLAPVAGDHAASAAAAMRGKAIVVDVGEGADRLGPQRRLDAEDVVLVDARDDGRRAPTSRRARRSSGRSPT